MLYKERTQASTPSTRGQATEAIAVDQQPKLKSQPSITLKTAKCIAMDLHSGMWSALYAFGSSGILMPESVGRTLLEIKENLNTKGISKTQLLRLRKLERFVAGQLPAGAGFEELQTANSIINP